jgi:hypothetical protein
MKSLDPVETSTFSVSAPLPRCYQCGENRPVKSSIGTNTRRVDAKASAKRVIARRRDAITPSTFPRRPISTAGGARRCVSAWSAREGDVSRPKPRLTSCFWCCRPARPELVELVHRQTGEVRHEVLCGECLDNYGATWRASPGEWRMIDHAYSDGYRG